MGYRNLQECVTDLERTNRLIRISSEIDPYLEAAEIHRRVFQAAGPAILFERLQGCQFPAVSNLFGTPDRTQFLFRDTLQQVRHLIELKSDPLAALRSPWKYWRAPASACSMLPRFSKHAPVLEHETSLSQLPQIVCWPEDGGPFITLPEVYSEDPAAPGLMKSNLGMYRIQLAGNSYQSDQAGLHYQIHRSLGVHHARAIERAMPLHVNVFVGGTPAMMLAAVMPLPEGMTELSFAGALSGRAIRMTRQSEGVPVYGEADFCLSGVVGTEQLPEGPFGDHLGYYARQHDFPVLHVRRVTHRRGAIWPFTVVGRPPQEDSCFGALIHELTGPVIPSVLPGIHGIHAVDAAGVHPLLLAIGSERYVPYATERRPQELLTLANAILGQGQLSLAKYLMIVAREDDPALAVHNVEPFFKHLLERVKWNRDLHFQTKTTIDTLDYTGTGLNEGSKVVIAAAGPPRRSLPNEIPSGWRLPDGFTRPELVLPGIVAITGPAFEHAGTQAGEQLCDAIGVEHPLRSFPLIVLVDDSAFTAATLNNFLWVTFTRSNPAADLYGVEAFTLQKHWGCHGPLLIDARIKPHHAPPLVEDAAVTRRVEALAADGGPLHGVF